MSNQIITGENIERAERIMRRTYAVGTNATSILDRARVDKEAFDAFQRHHRDVLFTKYLPDVDPRVEPAIMTMLMHFFAVGAISQRIAEGRA